jgi:4-diphosphocytidyl-2-C-methyl-D-erythritol kinase
MSVSALAGERQRPALVEAAPAKINLALHVTGRRADGYHLIDSLAAFCALGDRISVRAADHDHFSMDGPFAAALTADASVNLVVKARDALRSALGTGRTGPVAIHLEKNLPLASGIGGGSADAAAALRALARLWHSPDPDIMHSLAERLGADVPMCLASRPLRARGIGTELTLVPDLPSVSLVLVNPGIGVSTPAVFASLDRRDSPPLAPITGHLSTEGLVDYLGRHRNDLQPAASHMAPAIGEAL